LSSLAFIFPGQGAQRPGMGRPLFDAHPEARRAFAFAGENLCRDMEALCFDTPAPSLARTENAQPALFTVSMAAHWVCEAAGLRPSAVAGFSLGECAALCAAGYLSWADGLQLVRVRADAMQQAADTHPGAMAAVLGLPWDTVESLCHPSGGAVRPVNDNAPGQCVVAGTPDAVDGLSRAAAGLGAKIVPLPVSAAFHTPDMAGAGATLEAFMRRSLPPIEHGAIPLYANLTGLPLAPGADLPAIMAAQMQNPVRWRQSILAMCADGIDTFVEVGEGRTLSALVRRIDRNAKILPLPFIS